MEFDLLTTRPLEVSEAASREDLFAAMQRLRSRRTWNENGVPKSGILEEIDDTFIHHRDHYSRLVGGGSRGISSVRMVVEEGRCDITVEGSREWDPKAHSYRAQIAFQNYRSIEEVAGMTWPDKARMLLEDNVQVDCDCKAFQYFYRHTATLKGFALIPESEPSPIRNPFGRGAVCKHLEHALRYLGANYATIASAMKRQAQESPMPSVLDRINEELGEPTKPSPIVESGLATPASGGILPEIVRLIEAARARGMTKTANALFMAKGMAGIEGATTGNSTTPQPSLAPTK